MAAFSPYIGVDQLKFGMSSADIKITLGPPRLVRRTSRGEENEIRQPDQPRVSVAGGRLVEMSFLPAFGSLTLDGDSLFLGDPLDRLRHVQSAYGQLHLHVGFVVSLGGGIAFTGFHDGNTAQKAITVFERGRWERFTDKLKPFTM